MTTPVGPTQPFHVTLQAQEWNNLIAALHDAPYKISAPLIQSISHQLQEQADNAPQPNGTMGVGIPMQQPN